MNKPIDNIPSEDFLNEESEINEESYKPLISGVLLVIAGVLGILNFAILISADEMILSNYNTTMFSQTGMEITVNDIKNLLQICGIIGIIISIFPILSSILCFRRKLWGFALGSGIIGIFSMGPMFASTVLCIIAVILISMSKNEFDK